MSLNVNSNAGFHGAPFGQNVAQTHFEIGDEDPVSFIENEVLKASNKQSLKEAELEIHGKYEKEGGKIKAMAYGSPPRICFKKTYTVKFKDEHGQYKDITFEKVIYTSVKFPDAKGGERDYNNAIRLAAMAASLYGKSITNHLRMKAEGNYDPALASKFSQIQKDGLIRLEFFKGDQAIGNPLKLMRENKLDFSQISKVKLKFSMLGDTNALKKIDPLSIKVNEVFKKKEIGLLKRIAAKEFTIGVDENTPAYIQNTAEARKVRDILQTGDESSLNDQLESHNLSKSSYIKQLQTDFNAKMKEFEARQSFFRDLREVNNLRERYGEATDAALSQETLMHLVNKMPKIPQLEKIKFWKAKSQAPLHKAITELLEDPLVDKSVKDELTRLKQYLNTCHSEIKHDFEELHQIFVSLTKCDNSFSKKTREKMEKEIEACNAFLQELSSPDDSSHEEESDSKTDDFEENDDTAFEELK